MARTKKPGETPEQENAQTVPETEEKRDAPEQAATEPERALDAQTVPMPCVYCGPSVKGVAAQYTTFYGGLPDAVSDFLRERPEAAGLFTTPEKFEGMRRRLETYGTAEAALYRRVKEAVNRGNPV